MKVKFWSGSESHNIYTKVIGIFTKLQKENTFSHSKLKNIPVVVKHKRVIMSEEMKRSAALIDVDKIDRFGK